MDMCCCGETISCPRRAPGLLPSPAWIHAWYMVQYRHGAPPQTYGGRSSPVPRWSPRQIWDYAVPDLIVKRAHGSGPLMVPEHLVPMRALTSAQAPASTDDLVTDDRWRAGGRQNECFLISSFLDILLMFQHFKCILLPYVYPSRLFRHKNVPCLSCAWSSAGETLTTRVLHEKSCLEPGVNFFR